MSKSKQIVVVAAHPDDEALGCGGTLLKHKDAGYDIHLLFMTDGVSARENVSKKEHAIRRHEFETAIKFLEPKSYGHLTFPDNQLDSVPLLEVTQEIEKFITNIQPDIVLTHFWNDLNVDHCVTHRATMTACRPGSNHKIEKILCFEVPSSTEWAIGQQQFQPNYFVDISEWMDAKIDYIKCYETEMRAFPHPRSYEKIRSLHQYRGASVNVAYAEAFYLLRSLNFGEL